MRCWGRIGELVMRHNVAMRLLLMIAAGGVALLATGCTAGTAHQAARSASPLPPDPHTASALSNPDMVSLYRMPPQQYVKALGCAH